MSVTVILWYCMWYVIEMWLRYHNFPIYYHLTLGHINNTFDNNEYFFDTLRRTVCIKVLTSLHERVEERGVGEEEQVCQQLRCDLAVHLESVEQMQSRL